MSNYPDSSPNSKAKGASGKKNNDGRIWGDHWDKQADGSGDGGPGMPKRTASRNANKTYDPNEDAQSIAGGKAYSSNRREGLEEGAY